MGDYDERVQAAERLFEPIRRRFSAPGAERGGCLRAGVTPVYVRKFGEHAATVFPGLATVESSFDEAQLRAVTASLVALKNWINGAATRGIPTGDLAALIERHFLAATRPYFLLALLRATEQALAEFMAASPADAPVIDAIFRVAGSEGVRDLIQLYAAHMLEQTAQGNPGSLPDILAFVNLHERPGPSPSAPATSFEVWCPGYDLSKAFFGHCQRAARSLHEQGALTSIPSLAEETAQLPPSLVQHLNSYVGRLRGKG
jgi:hypothetical protein